MSYFLVSIRTEDGTENPLAEVLEDFSNVWQRADFTLYPTDKKYRVVFSAQYENTEVSEGDIAIDDVVFHENCKYVMQSVLLIILFTFYNIEIYSII